MNSKRRLSFICSLITLCFLFGYYVMTHLEQSEDWRKREDEVVQIEDPTVWNEVKFMLFFMGHGKSGTSLVGSLLDAHPNIIVPNEYDVIQKWIAFNEKQKNRDYLFQELYSKSVEDARHGKRAPAKDNELASYSYYIPHQWQGKFDKVVKVIGDKKAERFTIGVKENSGVLRSIQEVVKIPFKFIYILRNPFDIVATRMFRRQSPGSKSSKRWEKPIQYSKKLQIEEAGNLVDVINTAVNFTKRAGVQVMTMYSEDMIRNATRELKNLCAFLSVPCSDDYLKDCSSIVRTSPSKTRKTVIWDEDAKKIILKIMQNVEIFKRYSFNE